MSLTYILIGVTVLISLVAWNRPELTGKWIMNPFAVKKYKEYYRFLTSGFIHADYGHLFFNMLSLYFFGDIVEYYFAGVTGSSNMGDILYVGLYLLGIIVANIPSYADHNNNQYYNALGASGGVSAVVFSAILFHPTAEIYVYFFPIPGFIYGILYSFYSYTMSKRNVDNIGHSAHLYGAMFGVAFTLLLEPSLFSLFFEQILIWSKSFV